ncbi:7394_t:CDS:2 [Ambispora leptoticha]|uniref:D-arabinono-1,4-lactone oxidase n=1 Tax=Ambispora leptoticha TaxID=144679 RepID=A0A9N8WFK9_9GLOM|nr:7394_t:CDS:2 [Ambispora leptoticha]
MTKLSGLIFVLILIIISTSISEAVPSSILEERSPLYRKELRGFTLRSAVPSSDKTWDNWAGTIHLAPEAIFRPTTLTDLQDIVNLARTNGKTIRCAAEGHTYSSLSVTKKYLVIVNNLNKIQVLQSKQYGWVITAEAGTQISEIDHALRTNNPPLALSSATVLDEFRAAGVVATGSHGAKFALGLIADHVVSMKIVAADGKVYEFSDITNPLEMSAARVNLGLFGIIYSVTLRTEPMFNFRLTDTLPLAKDFLVPSVIKQLVESSDGVEIFYWPFNSYNQSAPQPLDPTKDKMWVKQWVRTDEQPTLTPEQISALHDAQNKSSLQGNQVYQLLLQNPQATPNVTASIWLEGPGKMPTSFVLQAPDAIHYEAGIGNIPDETLEFVFKVDPDYANVAKEFQAIINATYAAAAQNSFPLNLVAEARILKSTRTLLAPSFNLDPNAVYCFMEVTSYHYTPGYQTFAAMFGQRWIQTYKAKPHWAKEWEYVPNIKSYLSQAYKEQINIFEKIRAKYDPDKLFFDNESLQEIFRGALTN